MSQPVNSVTYKSQWRHSFTKKRKNKIPAGVIGNFHWHKILPIALWPRDRLILWQKWEPGTFPEGKGGRHVRLTNLAPSCAVVIKSGNLNFLEPSGPLQACNGTALPFLHVKSRRSQWPRGLRQRSAAACLLKLWVRIPPEALWSICFEYCVLSDRALCDGLITRPEESYRLWCVFECDLEN